MEDNFIQNRIKILKALIEADDMYCYDYSWLESETGLTRKELEPEVASLRSTGLVEHIKGLMTDDGEVAGSGFQIVYAKRQQVRDLIEKYGKN